MANHPKMPMPDNWVLYDLVFDGQSELFFVNQCLAGNRLVYKDEPAGKQ